MQRPAQWLRPKSIAHLSAMQLYDVPKSQQEKKWMEKETN